MPSGDLYPTARSDAAIIYCALWRPCVAFQQFLSGVFLVEAQPPPGRVLRPGRDSAFRAASEPLGSLLEWRADLDSRHRDNRGRETSIGDCKSPILEGAEPVVRLDELRRDIGRNKTPPIARCSSRSSVGQLILCGARGELLVSEFVGFEGFIMDFVK